MSEPSKLSLFFADLKRRGVTRLVSIYAVVGLGIIEAFDIIGGRFLLPDWTFNAVIIAIVVGFPVAIILGWIYDINDKKIVIGGGGRKAPAAVLFNVPGSCSSVDEAVSTNASLGN